MGVVIGMVLRAVFGLNVPTQHKRRMHMMDFFLKYWIGIDALYLFLAEMSGIAREKILDFLPNCLFCGIYLSLPSPQPLSHRHYCPR